jgi:hypothetical protein
MEAECRLHSGIGWRRAEDRLLLLLAERHGLAAVAELAQPRDDFNARHARILRISGEKTQRERVTIAFEWWRRPRLSKGFDPGRQRLVEPGEIDEQYEEYRDDAHQEQ